jgi:protein TonB
VQLKKDIQQGPGVGSGSGVGVGAGLEAGLPQRAMLTSNAAGGSGGINTASYRRDTGGGGLAGRSTTLVAGGLAVAAAVASAAEAATRAMAPARAWEAEAAGPAVRCNAPTTARPRARSKRSSSSSNATRARSIPSTTARCAKPSLQVKVVLELKIAPSGEVLECRIASRELNAAELERKLLARIRQFEFGAKDVEQMVVTWPVDFLPS